MTDPSLNGQLFCHIRAGVILSFRLGENSVIGREQTNAVAVPVEGVSRMHARIRFDGKSYWLEDLKSTNGTFLNGQAVTRDRLLHLDVITLGRELDLVFVLRATPEVQKFLAITRAALVREGGEAAPYDIAPGEITLGRAPSNNLVAETGAVSKVHARIERTRGQLVLQDLGSANGTFLNGAKVTEAFLKDGDTVSLAGVETYKVVVEMGEVTSASGRHSAAAIAAGMGKPRFSAEWKTRFDWSDEELGELAELRRRLEDRESEIQARREQADKSKKPRAGKTARLPTVPKSPAGPPAKAAAAPVKPAATPTPAAPAARPAKPAAPPDKAAAPPASTATPPAPAPAVVPAAASPAPARPSAPKPEAPPRPPPSPEVVPPAAVPPVVATPAPVPPAAVKPDAPAATATGPILAVRLRGAGFSLAVTEPGEYDLGRSREAALRVEHPTVSRRHARIILSDDRASAFLQDQGGANGTRLNGREVTKLARLADQDTIGVGEVDLIVSLERA